MHSQMQEKRTSTDRELERELRQGLNERTGFGKLKISRQRARYVISTLEKGTRASLVSHRPVSEHNGVRIRTAKGPLSDLY
jgi:hypothetical protein